MFSPLSVRETKINFGYVFVSFKFDFFNYVQLEILYKN